MKHRAAMQRQRLGRRESRTRAWSTRPASRSRLAVRSGITSAPRLGSGELRVLPPHHPAEVTSNTTTAVLWQTSRTARMDVQYFAIAVGYACLVLARDERRRAPCPPIRLLISTRSWASQMAEHASASHGWLLACGASSSGWEAWAIPASPATLIPSQAL